MNEGGGFMYAIEIENLTKSFRGLLSEFRHLSKPDDAVYQSGTEGPGCGDSARGRWL